MIELKNFQVCLRNKNACWKIADISSFWKLLITVLEPPANIFCIKRKFFNYVIFVFFFLYFYYQNFNNDHKNSGKLRFRK